MQMTILCASLCATLVGVTVATARDRPAPPPSRYNYSLKIDEKSLPRGVTIDEVKDDLGTRYFIRNTSEVPLIINERFQGERLVSGTKLVSGKVYQYFPNGVPMEGKQHLIGWQAPFGDIERTILMLANEPAKIYEGRQPGLSNKLPAPEATIIPARYDDKPYEIKATVVYGLNPGYER